VCVSNHPLLTFVQADSSDEVGSFCLCISPGLRPALTTAL